MAARTDVPHTIAQMEELWNKLVSEASSIPFQDSKKEETLLEILEAEPKASVFLTGLKKYPHLYEVLGNTTTENTIFAPLNDGWPVARAQFPIGNLHGGWSASHEENLKGPRGANATDQPLNEEDPAIEQAALSMHISPHYFPMEDFLGRPNIPTMMQCLVSNRRPVLNINADASGYTINGTPIVNGNIRASNGIVHLIAAPFYLPMPLEKILSNRQDTTMASRAFQSMVPKLLSGSHDQALFVPSDQAIKDLGHQTVKFLFETESGLQYLTALLKYHVYPHTTVFNNMIWPNNDTGDTIKSTDVRKVIKGIARHKAASALFDRHGVAKEAEIKFVRCGGLISTFVNENAYVTVSSIAAINGSINVIDRILLPDFTGSKELSVQQIKDLLADYV